MYTSPARPGSICPRTDSTRSEISTAAASARSSTSAPLGREIGLILEVARRSRVHVMSRADFTAEALTGLFRASSPCMTSVRTALAMCSWREVFGAYGVDSGEALWRGGGTHPGGRVG